MEVQTCYVKEGLPRIIASGQWDHANEFVIPGVLFLYITGWIGWVDENMYVTQVHKKIHLKMKLLSMYL
jgi:photosystem I subunit 3